MRTLIPHRFFRGALPAFSPRPSFCASQPPRPLSPFSACHSSLCTNQIPRPSSVKTSKQKRPSLLWVMLQDIQVSGNIKERRVKKKKKKQHLNNRQVLSTKAFLWCYKASAALFTLHDSTFLLRESQRKIKEGDCFKSEHILLLTILFMWLC